MTPGFDLNLSIDLFSAELGIDSHVDSNTLVAKENSIHDRDANEFENTLNDREESIKEHDDSKNKKNNLKNKLEKLDEELNIYLYGLPQPTQELIQPTLIAVTIEPGAQEYTEIIAAKFNETLENKNELLIKEIAGINLDAEGAIQDILALSDKLELISELKNSLENKITNPEANMNPKLESELNILLESRVEEFIETYVENKQAIKAEAESSKLDLLAEDLEIEITDLSKQDGSQAPGSDASSAGSNESFVFDNNPFVTFNQTITSFKTVIIKETININKLDSFISDRVPHIANNKKETLDITLTPGDLGKVQLSITRYNDKLEIKMHFSSQDSMDSVEHKLNELQQSLKAKGFETEIKVTADNSSSNLNSNSENGQSANSFNEARDQQKEKILNTVPAWLTNNDSNHKASFAKTLEGIIE